MSSGLDESLYIQQGRRPPLPEPVHRVPRTLFQIGHGLSREKKLFIFLYIYVHALGPEHRQPTEDL